MVLDGLLLLVTAMHSPPIEGSRAVATVIERVWPRRPEWADMLAAILEDKAMDPRKGWWRPPASAYGWPWLRGWCDEDGDGRVAEKELARAPELFERLDLDEDGGISELDFQPPPDPPPGLERLFRLLDLDEDERVSRDEVSRVFEDADRRKRGFLSRRDLARAFFELPEDRPGRLNRSRRRSSSRMPEKWTLLYFLFNGQLGSLREGPALLEQAPDVELTSLETGGPVQLARSFGARPVVLIFGSFT